MRSLDFSSSMKLYLGWWYNADLGEQIVLSMHRIIQNIFLEIGTKQILHIPFARTWIRKKNRGWFTPPFLPLTCNRCELSILMQNTWRILRLLHEIPSTSTDEMTQNFLCQPYSLMHSRKLFGLLVRLWESLPVLWFGDHISTITDLMDEQLDCDTFLTL